MLPLSKNHAPEIAKRSADNSRKTIMRANWQELKEERKMCEALRELFADDLRESREEGITEGRNVGKLEGAASKVIEIVIKKYKKGYSVKETADMLEEPVSRIQQIYDVIEKNAPDYDAETIYKQLREKEE